MSDKFSITITAKARHGKLWELRKKFGTTKALAKYLGVSQSEFGLWLNLKSVPPKRMSKERRLRIDEKLAPFGCLLEDLFPIELTDDILDKPKEFEITREVDLKLLADAGAIKLIESPYDEVEHKNLQEQIGNSLNTLTPREEKVIKLHFGLDGEDEHSYQEIANILEVTNTRVQQIESKGLRRLRHISRSKNLRNFLKGEESQQNINVKFYERYKAQKEIVFVDTFPIMCSLYSIAVSSTIEMFNGFAESGTYIRVYINTVLEWACRINKEDVGVRDHFNSNQTMCKVMPRIIKIEKGYIVSVVIGPILKECVKHKRLIKDIDVVLACAPVKYKEYEL
jgi:RNA polymerase sigma factor (sigma-70 family)